MTGLLQRFVADNIATGRLQVTYASGEARIYGDGSGPLVRIRFRTAAAERALLLDPEMKLGEEYMNGGYDIESGSVLDFLTLLVNNIGRGGRTWWTHALAGARFALSRVVDRNGARRARDNVQHHYDLDGRLYSLFLDEDRQYSCAYFEDGVTNLEEAQCAKKRHIAGKLNLKPGQRVLDIGSGWGGLGIYLAERYDVEVVGVTLSEEQFAMSNQRAKARGLADRVNFQLKDYRHLDGPFDRIVSVGMFEHVGLSHYREFFRNVNRLLAPDGVSVVHTIARVGQRSGTNPWIARYIFPGGYIPSLSELAPHTEDQRLWLTDLEVWRLHYAKTLREWSKRFQANRAKVAAMYDERFCRMWEFYLQASEVAFRLQGLCVFQMQLAKRIDTVPITREYMYGTEPSVLDIRPVTASPSRS